MSSIKSIVESGNSATRINVECHITNGLPNIIIVGFANRAVDEAKERLRGAFHSSNINFPKKRITINLAPADIPKDSSSYDLAIAVAIMNASEQIKNIEPNNTIFIGELGLKGDVRPVRGIIGKLIAAKSLGYNSFVIPKENLGQALLVPGISIIPIGKLNELYLALSNTKPIIPIDSKNGQKPINIAKPNSVELQDITGQFRAKRVLEIAAAGGHNVMFSGPPGTGKSMLAKALPSILPEMGLEEILEVTHLHSLASNNYDQIITERPFRSPHHSASEVAIIGGGVHARPGEISLAHRGVLLLDEFPEYNRSTIEALRQPLEDKEISIARAKINVVYPADFMLIATSNPCPCGYWGTNKNCTCMPHMIIKYQQKLSGPILDRIDLFTEVDNVKHNTLLKTNKNLETSDSVKAKVTKARNMQNLRYGSVHKINALLSNKEIKKYANLDNFATELLNQAAEKLQISARAYMRIVKVARTIADLDNSKIIGVSHVSEAIAYRKQNNYK